MLLSYRDVLSLMLGTSTDAVPQVHIYTIAGDQCSGLRKQGRRLPGGSKPNLSLVSVDAVPRGRRIGTSVVRERTERHGKAKLTRRRNRTPWDKSFHLDIDIMFRDSQLAPTGCLCHDDIVVEKDCVQATWSNRIHGLDLWVTESLILGDVHQMNR